MNALVGFGLAALLIMGIVFVVMPDVTTTVAKTVVTDQQIEQSTVEVPFVAEPIPTLKVLPWVIIGFVVLMTFALAARSMN